jgi:hypothetical protein
MNPPPCYANEVYVVVVWSMAWIENDDSMVMVVVLVDARMHMPAPQLWPQDASSVQQQKQLKEGV